MTVQAIIAAVVFAIGLAGFITSLCVGLAFKFTAVTIGIMVFFFVCTCVGLVAGIQVYGDKDKKMFSCWHGTSETV